MMTIIVNNAVIEGNHVFNNTPPLNEYLNVDLENEQLRYRSPLLVWLPTEAHNDSRGHGRVRFGHVPSGLAQSFRNIINQGGSISAIATGPPCDSFPPRPQRFDKGGGKVIPCTYIIKTDQPDCVSSLTSALEGSAMTLSVSET